MKGTTKLLLIYMNETDTWADTAVPLVEAVVELLYFRRIAGCTVHRGTLGFGAGRHMQSRRLFGLNDQRPVTISVIDEEERLRALLPKLRQMVKAGVMFLVDGEMIPSGE